MNPELVSLIRKEWRERRWVLATCIVWMLCCLVYVVAYEWTRRFRAPVASYYTTCLFYTMFAAVFLAMKTALGEVTQGTLSYSLSLPVSRQRLAEVRLAGSIVVLLLPVLIGALLLTPILGLRILEQAPVRPTEVYVQLPLRPPLSGSDAVALLWTTTAIASAGGMQLLLILSIIGARRTSEAQVGFCGAVLVFVWLTLTQVRISLPHASGWIGAIFPVSSIINWGYATEKGSYTDLDLGTPVWWPLGVNMLLLAALAWWFLHLYGTGRRIQVSGRPRFWRRRPAIWSYVPVWLPTKAAALVWVNLRQSVSMAVWGLILALGITLLQFSDFEDGETFRGRLPNSVWIVGMLWAAIVGVGVFAAELQPGLSRFWRSRPISVAAWFWCKFFIGLTAVLAVLDGFTIYYSWGTPIDFTSGLSLSYVACMPVLHGTIYAVAVLGICWLRRPILGGTLAIGGYFVTSALVSSIAGEAFDPINVHNALLGDELKNGRIELTAHYYPLVFGTQVAIALASAWFAYWAVRRPEVPAIFRRRRAAATT